MQKFQLCSQTYLLHVGDVGAGMVCAGLGPLESLHQNICGGTDFILGLVDQTQVVVELLTPPCPAHGECRQISLLSKGALYLWLFPKQTG